MGEVECGHGPRGVWGYQGRRKRVPFVTTRGRAWEWISGHRSQWWNLMVTEESFNLGLTHTYTHTHSTGALSTLAKPGELDPVHLWVALSSTEATKPHIK